METETDIHDLLRQADRNPHEGYFMDSSLQNYNTFIPGQQSLEKLIQPIIDKKKQASILEVGFGYGNAAAQLKQIFKTRIKYDGIALTSPSEENRSAFTNILLIPIDNFYPRDNQKYDLIFSINGLVYGENDLNNFIRLANSTNKDGYLIFNFDGFNYDVNKQTKFNNFLYFNFLDALCNLSFWSFYQNNQGRKVFFGKRRNKQDLTINDINKQISRFQEYHTTLIQTSFGKFKHIIWPGEQSKVISYIKKTTQQKQIKDKKFIDWITRENCFVDLIGGKMPVEEYVDSYWHEYKIAYHKS